MYQILVLPTVYSNDDDDVLQAFGVEVLGLDLSANMVDIAIERSMEEKLPSVSLIGHQLNEVMSLLSSGLGSV